MTRARWVRAAAAAFAVVVALCAACGGRSDDDLFAAGGAAGSAGSAGSGAAAGTGATGGSGGTGGATLTQTDKVDLLLMIDNSISMGDKQALLADAVPSLVSRLTSPRCVDPATGQPNGGVHPCAAGVPEFSPVRDLHVGVVTSSLGAHGGQICDPQNATPGATPDDKARLVGSLRPGLSSHKGLGFLWWAPDAGGENNVAALITNFGAHVVAAGESGCGYEASLEAWYRFLIDPEPPAAVVVQDGFAVVQGVDAVVLQQRKDFLRSDSAVVVAMLSDENDCSIRDGGPGVLGQAWLVTAQTSGGIGLPRATSTCAKDPDDPCCHSCGQGTVAGCPPTSSDPECAKGNYPDAEDHYNLRCWDQKRRFGIDWLYPTSRYVAGLTQTTIENRAGQPVQNPLFAAAGGVGRDPSLVFLLGIVGVPWQLIATAESVSDQGTLRFLNAEQLTQQGVWAKIAPVGQQQPADAHMREHFLPRPGLAGPGSGSLADPIHGHEWDVAAAGGSGGPGDLQYACIFPLVPEKDCEAAPFACPCTSTLQPSKSMNPLCQNADGSYGTTQRYAKAYPGLRQLSVLRDVGAQGVVASICPKRVGGDKTLPVYGYNAATDALVTRLAGVLK